MLRPQKEGPSIKSVYEFDRAIYLLAKAAILKKALCSRKERFCISLVRMKGLFSAHSSKRLRIPGRACLNFRALEIEPDQHRQEQDAREENDEFEP